eukprot:scaffold275730_cov19-Tisochrysis_lutea.AAC.1
MHVSFCSDLAMGIARGIEELQPCITDATNASGACTCFALFHPAKASALLVGAHTLLRYLQCACFGFALTNSLSE